MLRSALLYLSNQPRVFRFVRNNKLAKRFARRFVAGETLEDALEIRRRFGELCLDVDERQLRVDEPPLFVEHIDQSQLAQAVRLSNHIEIPLRLVDDSALEQANGLLRRTDASIGGFDVERDRGFEILAMEARGGSPRRSAASPRAP